MSTQGKQDQQRLDEMVTEARSRPGVRTALEVYSAAAGRVQPSPVVAAPTRAVANANDLAR